jgi:hypothetical protein
MLIVVLLMLPPSNFVYGLDIRSTDAKVPSYRMQNSPCATFISLYIYLDPYHGISINHTPPQASALKGALSALFKHSSIILHIFCLSTLLGILTPN